MGKTNGSAATKEKRPKQGRLFRDKVIEEIEDRAEKYVEARDERMALTQKEVAASAALIAVLKKHHRKEYHGRSYIARLTFEKEKVKVQRTETGE